MRDQNYLAAIDMSYRVYDKYSTRVYVELILIGKYHSINNRVGKKTRNVLTRAGHTHLAHVGKVVKESLAKHAKAQFTLGKLYASYKHNCDCILFTHSRALM